ncbi:unnamed protein product [marine sediment metagenome]|uniref:Response regulatory domain-containing protein n=1 Tax=marine sediment metagenome TaxID=412755 RepID=X1S0Y2_9ZZZZ
MKKILIAIDNDFMRETYSEVFKAEDFEVLKTKNGKEVLDMAKQMKPDIIIADIELSEMEGFRVLEAIKKDPDIKDIPVIIFAHSKSWGIHFLDFFE